MPFKNFFSPATTAQLTPAIPPTRFQVLSDLHLELCQQYTSFTVPPKAPYLILAGDIGRLIDLEPFRVFLANQCASFTRVFLVLGNHEFYGNTHVDGVAAAKALALEECMNGKLIILHRERIDLDENLTLLGCSLWSSVPEDKEEAVRLTLSDFRHIKEWSVAAHNEQHGQDASWLREEVRKVRAEEGGEGRRILVVSHHAPFLEGSTKAKHRRNNVESAYATDMIGALEGLGPGDCWIFGHTHRSMEGIRKGVRVFANQRGYVFPDGVSLEPKVEVVKEKSGLFGRLLGSGSTEMGDVKEFSVESVIEV